MFLRFMLKVFPVFFSAKLRIITYYFLKFRTKNSKIRTIRHGFCLTAGILFIYTYVVSIYLTTYGSEP